MLHVKDLFDLTGRTAVVTGGAGADVVVASRDAAKCADKASELVENGIKAVGMAVEVTEECSIKEFCRQVLEKFGKITLKLLAGEKC